MNREDHSFQIESPVSMSETNQNIEIFEGTYSLKSEILDFKIKGKINFNWLPERVINFEGSVLEKTDRLSWEEFAGKLILVIEGNEFGEAIVYQIEGNEDKFFISGILVKEAIIGNRTLGVTSVKFSVPNLVDFHGSAVKSKNGYSTIMGRVTFETDKYIIYLDKCSDYNEKLNKLKKNGGFITLYGGEVIKKNGTIFHKEIPDLFFALATYLSFFNGRETSPIFAHGIYENQIQWKDFRALRVYPYKYVHNCTTWQSTIEIEHSWKEFYKLWNDQYNKDFILSAINWYLSSNAYLGKGTGAIIMAQTALELLYNWIIVEQRKLISGKDAEMISACNKIRLLLSQVGITIEVPTKYSELIEFISLNKDISDAPEAITRIRNAIIHAQLEKRKRFSLINKDVKNQVLQLSIWYIELTILFVLKYNGYYNNRTAKVIYESQAYQLVPWCNHMN